MGLSDKEIEDMIDQLDTGDDQNIPDEVKKDHQLIRKGIQYIEEEAFKKKMESAEKSMKGASFLNFRFYVTSGIAACLALALFWYNGTDSSADIIELQMEEIPAYADSATYDTLKNIFPEVDKLEE